MYTSPETVLEDIARAMDLAGMRDALPPGIETLLKINISWQHYYPACSSTPWQLDGAIRALRGAGYDRLTPVHNGTVVVDPREGALNNKHEAVTEMHGLESVFLEDAEWVDFEPREPLMVLDKVYPDGFKIPRMLMGKNIVHLPTVKTHVFTTMTGAMKNAFGGLLNYQRHWTHSVIHETLVDLLQIQKQIHPGVFALMDGTFAGDGPGPRAMRWHAKNVILGVGGSGGDRRRFGEHDGLRSHVHRLHTAGARARAWYVGVLDEIDVVGADIEEVNWGFSDSRKHIRQPRPKANLLGPPQALGERPAAFAHHPMGVCRVQRLSQRLLAESGRTQARAREAMKTDWGKLFKEY